MKRGLKIEDNYYLNMDFIATWSFGCDYVRILTSFEGPDMFITTERPEFPPGVLVIIVPIQEVKRIEREISEYMGTN